MEIYLTNLGKYNEGYLVGQWVKLPVLADKLQEVFRQIKIDGKEYEEYFITDYETEVIGVGNAISEYSSITSLNELAEKLEELSEYEKGKLQAVLEYEGTMGTKNIIKLIDCLDDFDLLSDVEDEEDLGYYYIEKLCCLAVSETLKLYFNYESYGRDVDLEGNGAFTSLGYVIDNR